MSRGFPHETTPWDIDRFVAELAGARVGAARNVYRGRGGPARRRRLVAYLLARASAPLLLVGEALGHRGGARTGLPFTCERDLLGAGEVEVTARLVQRALGDLGVADRVLLWNVVPAHPHRPGQPHSNRPPTSAEVRAGLPFARRLAIGRVVVGVGRWAATALCVPYLGHPSHGGAAAFTAGLRALVAAHGLAAHTAPADATRRPGLLLSPSTGRPGLHPVAVHAQEQLR